MPLRRQPSSKTWYNPAPEVACYHEGSVFQDLARCTGDSLHASDAHHLSVPGHLPRMPCGPCTVPRSLAAFMQCNVLAVDAALQLVHACWFLCQLHSLAAAVELDRGQHVEEFVAGAAQLNQAEGTARQVVTTVVRSISELQQGVKDVGFENRDG